MQPPDDELVGVDTAARFLRSGKRDRYDIGKMGSFGLWFGDATDIEGRSWWNGFSRFKSRHGAISVVRESGRLPSIRAGFADTLDQSPMRICAYAVMPNHWHLLLWPECDGELAAFMQRLTITHVRRWQEHRGYAGLGHVYQGRYKSFPVESESISGLSPDKLSATRCAAISSCERRNGGGQACGNAVILREKSGRCWRRGRSICRDWLERVNPTDERRHWKGFSECATRPPLWPAGMAEGNRTTFGPRVGLSFHGSPHKGWAEMGWFRLVEDRSDVGGTAQFNNIGPVPLPVRFLLPI